jgi:taurine---2-oxoglutarate transaminase
MQMQQVVTAEDLLRKDREHVLHSWSAQGAIKPKVISRAKGNYFWDAEGIRYLDFMSQLAVVNIGHGHPRVLEAIRRQADRLCYANPAFATEPAVELATELAGLAPGDINRSLFTLAGADAIENAIRMARLYTGRQKIIARYHSYHGATAGALTATGDPRRWAMGGELPGVVHALDPYRYRCSFCKTQPACTLQCADHIEEIIRLEGPQNVAAVLLEPIIGANGNIVPPDGYLQSIRATCDRYGILLIADEVQSGLGRTGRWFGADHWDVVPDMVCLAKGLTSGYVPLGALLIREPIAHHFDDHIYWGGLTYSAHALSCAAALANIQVVKDEKLVENARAMGELLLRGLKDLESRHPSVGEGRGLGLMAGLELVYDKHTREPLIPRDAASHDTAGARAIAEFMRAIMAKGLYTLSRWNYVLLSPPLTITADEVQWALSIIDECLAITDAVAAA